MAAFPPGHEDKPNLSVVVAGHVDAGKSTLVGSLLFEMGAMDERKKAQLLAAARDAGKESFYLAYCTDTTEAEQERGLTIEARCVPLVTPTYRLTLIDAPGHRAFIKNMISGVSQADSGILVIDGSPGAFEAGLCDEGSTREHALLMSTLGIKTLIVAINKVDHDGFNGEERYEEVITELRRVLRKVGYGKGRVTFVPISGFHNLNLCETSSPIDWYEGPTLVEALDALTPPERPVDAPLRVLVQDVVNISGVGSVMTGRVESGTLRKGDSLVVCPTMATGPCRSIQMFHRDVEEAECGMNVGFTARGITKKQVRSGCVIGREGETAPRCCSSFIAQVIVVNHPTGIRAGYAPVVDCGTQHVSCAITRLIAKIDKRSGDAVEDEPAIIQRGDCALVEFVPSKPLVVECFKEIPALGRIAIRDMGQTVMVGVVKEVKYEADVE